MIGLQNIDCLLNVNVRPSYNFQASVKGSGKVVDEISQLSMNKTTRNNYDSEIINFLSKMCPYPL